MASQSKSIPRPLVRLNQWTIVICVLATWFTNEKLILLIPLIAGLFGVIFKVNPIIKFGKLFLRKKSTEYIPEDFDQQQFNQVIAVICLLVGFVSYLLGWKIIAIIFTAMVGLSAFIAILGFCIGCYIRFQWQQYNYRKSIS